MPEFYYPELSKIIVDLAFKVHTVLGPGLLESCYESCLEYELKKQNLSVRRQVSFPIIYDGIVLPDSYKIDLLIEDKIILELKSVDAITEIHFKQLLTYLRLCDKKVGYLMNFNVPSFKNGFYRKVV